MLAKPPTETIRRILRQIRFQKADLAHPESCAKIELAVTPKTAHNHSLFEVAP